MNAIGDQKIKYYQKFTIILGIIIISLFFILWLFKFIEGSIVLFAIFLLGIIVLIYSQVYLIQYDDKYFYLSNIYKKIKVPSNEFNKINKVIFLPLFYKIHFKSSSYFFILESSTVYKKFFSFGKLKLGSNWV